MNDTSRHLTDEAFADLLAGASATTHDSAESLDPEVLG